VNAVELPRPDSTLGIVEAAALAEPGTEMRLPPAEYVSRHAFVICSAPDIERCRLRLDVAASRVALDWEPLPAAEAMAS